MLSLSLTKNKKRRIMGESSGFTWRVINKRAGQKETKSPPDVPPKLSEAFLRRSIATTWASCCRRVPTVLRLVQSIMQLGEWPKWGQARAVSPRDAWQKVHSRRNKKIALPDNNQRSARHFGTMHAIVWPPSGQFWASSPLFISFLLALRYAHRLHLFLNTTLLRNVRILCAFRLRA